MILKSHRFGHHQTVWNTLLLWTYYDKVIFIEYLKPSLVSHCRCSLWSHLATRCRHTCLIVISRSGASTSWWVTWSSCSPYLETSTFKPISRKSICPAIRKRMTQLMGIQDLQLVNKMGILRNKMEIRIFKMAAQM